MAGVSEYHAKRNSLVIRFLQSLGELVRKHKSDHVKERNGVAFFYCNHDADAVIISLSDAKCEHSRFTNGKYIAVA